ncbi:MAG: DUF1858 domain-containing protein [Oscillospiraceae bacterium]|nr:DUF1858 domain-containing protein [Oscillospiraceae bacterium]
MAYDEKTRLSQILDEHPWLEQELPRRYPELKKLDNPAGRFMFRRMNVKDASRFSGIPAEKLLEKLERVIAEVEGQK